MRGIIQSWAVRGLDGTRIYLAANWRPGTDASAAEAELAGVEAEFRRRGGQVTCWWDILTEHGGDWLAALEADAAALAAADWVIFVGDGDNEGAWEAAAFIDMPVTRFEHLVLMPPLRVA